MRPLRIFGAIALVGALLVTVLYPAHSAEAETINYGGGSVQAYAASSPISVGTIVTLAGQAANRVAIATQQEVQNMFGVVVDPAQLPIVISGAVSENETFVAASGTYNVLVSTQGGPIATGDYLTLSAANGVAMRAGDQEVTVFGRANSGFDGKTTTLGKTTLKDSSGGNQEVYLGLVPVTIDIKNNPNHLSTEANVPDFLKRVGKAIAEKEVSPVRIYLSVAIAVISLIAAIVVTYAGIRNSVISIGRNPMSKKSIFKALVEVILTAILILVIGLFAVYLLLRL